MTESYSIRSSIKIGTTDLHSPSDLLANLDAVLPYIASRIPQAPASFSNIQSLHLKTSTSTSLPIYNAPLSERFEGTGLTAEQEKERAEKLEKKKAEKEERKKRDEERDARKRERSATKDGLGRFEKKRERKDEEADGDEQVEAEAEKAPEAKEPKAKKAKKASAAPSAGKKASAKKAKA